MISPNLEKTIKEAFEFAKVQKHEYVTLEHLLSNLINDEDALSVLKACAVDVDLLKNHLQNFILND